MSWKFMLANEPEFATPQDEIDWLRSHIGAEPADLAEAWERGYTAGGSITRRRWSDEPSAPDYPNPYTSVSAEETGHEQSEVERLFQNHLDHENPDLKRHMMSRPPVSEGNTNRE